MDSDLSASSSTTSPRTTMPSFTFTTAFAALALCALLVAPASAGITTFSGQGCTGSKSTDFACDGTCRTFGGRHSFRVCCFSLSAPHPLLIARRFDLGRRRHWTPLRHRLCRRWLSVGHRALPPRYPGRPVHQHCDGHYCQLLPLRPEQSLPRVASESFSVLNIVRPSADHILL